MYHYAGNNPVKYTDPDGRSGKNTVVVIGQPGGAGDNFEVAGRTWIEENVSNEDSVIILHAKDYENATDLVNDIKKAYGEKGIDNLVYFGHSYADGLTTQADDETRNERDDADAWILSLSGVKFNSDSNIYLYGCNAGNAKAMAKYNLPCIAQSFANETGATVWGYDYYSFATADPVLGHYGRLPTDNDILTKLPQDVKKAWFVCNNGKKLTKFTKQ
ncbi:MAG: hypothetical protein IK024_09300 [Treponema sp.]|nr:hypothetical protein [Treponema sp.]